MPGSRTARIEESFKGISRSSFHAFINWRPTAPYLNLIPHHATFSLMVIPAFLWHLYQDFFNAASRLNFSLDPSVTFAKLRARKFTWAEIIEYVFITALATFWLALMPESTSPLHLLIPMLYIIALVIPATSQFFAPAAPILIWVMSRYNSQWIPSKYRPQISVTLLPTLESVLYGGNVSDILTRYTNPFFDVVAWLPYGVIHFTAPFAVAAALWLWQGNVGKGNNEALKLWARVFGYMNLAGVLIQLVFPCAPPCKFV
jgi:hypothetical protein